LDKQWTGKVSGASTRILSFAIANKLHHTQTSRGFFTKRSLNYCYPWIGLVKICLLTKLKGDIFICSRHRVVIN